MSKFINKILEGVLFQKIFKNPFFVLDNLICPVIRKHYLATKKINKQKILFVTFTGAYTCNPKAIADEIIKRKLPYELVWATCAGKSKGIPENFKVVLQASAEFYEEAATSKLWICNGIAMTFYDVPKKKEQILMQTWHGAIGIKRFDTYKSRKWIKQIKADGKKTDYSISNSTFETNLYRTTFWKNNEILEYGHARNDILFTQNEEIKEKIYAEYSIPKGVKIAMYAPTFRDDKGLDYYNIDYYALRESLTQKFGGEWIILTRLHSRLKKKRAEFNLNNPDFTIDVTNYDDIQELMLITDVGITDYSSWICEFLYTRKPAFLYATDLNSFNHERGLLFPLEEFPCSFAANNDELCNNIQDFDMTKYSEKITQFLIDKGSVDDGKAAIRVVDKIEELMKNQ